MSPMSSLAPSCRFSSETAVNPPKRMVHWLSCRSVGGGLAGVSIASGNFPLPERPDKQSLRPSQHQRNEHHRIKHHPVIAKLAENFIQHCKQNRRDDDPDIVAHSTQNDHHDDFNGFGEIET